MLIGAFVMAAHGFQPFGETLLGDAVGNSAGGKLGVRDIDRLSAQHGGEHQRKGGSAGGGRATRAFGLLAGILGRDRSAGGHRSGRRAATAP